MQPYSQSELVDWLCAESERPMCFLFGAGVVVDVMPSTKRIVQIANELTSNIREAGKVSTTTDDPLSAADSYQETFKAIEQSYGRFAASRVIRLAVSEALLDPSSVARKDLASDNVEVYTRLCKTLESSFERWNIPVALQHFVELVVLRNWDYVHVLTTNFDPLI